MNVRQLIIVLLLTLPSIVLAGPFEGPPATRDFVPIQPLPGTSGGQATSGGIAAYINTLFQYALAAGAALAAIYIAIGGFEYIFSEAMESKKNGRLRIVHALSGLAILLLVTVILYVIGGTQALCLDFLTGCGRR